MTLYYKEFYLLRVLIVYELERVNYESFEMLKSYPAYILNRCQFNWSSSLLNSGHDFHPFELNASGVFCKGSI